MEVLAVFDTAKKQPKWTKFKSRLQSASEWGKGAVVSDSLRPQNYTVRGILQAITLEQVAILFSRGSSQPRDRTQVFSIAGRFFTSWATRGEHILIIKAYSGQHLVLWTFHQM